MSSLFFRALPSGRRLVLLDLALALWSVVWIAMGIWVHDEVRGLADLSDTVSNVGTAVDTSGATLAQLNDLPLVGGRLEEPAHEIQEAGQRAVESGRSSRRSVQNLSVLLGLSVALIPSIPLVALYVPLRLARVREAAALRWAYREGVGDPGFPEFLARRASESVPYLTMRRQGLRPWREGDRSRLALAELERAGVQGAEEQLRFRA